MSLTLENIRRTCTAQAVIDTPLGAMRLARTAAGLAGVWFEGQKHHPGTLAAQENVFDPLLQHAAQQLRRYFDADPAEFDLTLDLIGTSFQRRVWAALQAIPAGATCSYGDVARAIGSANAVRAVGAAVGRNPLSLIVPCHRVIGSTGALTGYAGGVERKQALLALEQSALRAPRRARA